MYLTSVGTDQCFACPLQIDCVNIFHEVRKSKLRKSDIWVNMDIRSTLHHQSVDQI